MDERVTASSMTAAPPMDQGPGFSPVNRKTQTGFNRGSRAAISMAERALILVIPLLKSTRLNPVWKIPRAPVDIQPVISGGGLLK